VIPHQHIIGHFENENVDWIGRPATVHLLCFDLSLVDAELSDFFTVNYFENDKMMSHVLYIGLRKFYRTWYFQKNKSTFRTHGWISPV